MSDYNKTLKACLKETKFPHIPSKNREYTIEIDRDKKLLYFMTEGIRFYLPESFNVLQAEAYAEKLKDAREKEKKKEIEERIIIEKCIGDVLEIIENANLKNEKKIQILEEAREDLINLSK